MAISRRTVNGDDPLRRHHDRYVRLNVTASTGWPAGQVGELEVYAS